MDPFCPTLLCLLQASGMQPHSTCSWHSRDSCMGNAEARSSLTPVAPPLINRSQVTSLSYFFTPGGNFRSALTKTSQKSSQNQAAVFQSSHPPQSPFLYRLCFLLFQCPLPILAPWDHFPLRVSAAQDLSRLCFLFKCSK